MRHRVAGRKLGRKKDVRAALRRNMIKQLFEYERIRTTRAKAQAVRGQAERLITLAKRGNEAGDAQMVHARRLAAAFGQVIREKEWAARQLGNQDHGGTGLGHS